MANATRTVTTTIDLDAKLTMPLEAAAFGCRIRVLRGALWLTEEGEFADAVLHAGDEHVPRGGRVLIGGLGPVRVQMVQEAAPAASRAFAPARRALRYARAAIRRLQFGQPLAERAGFEPAGGY